MGVGRGKGTIPGRAAEPGASTAMRQVGVVMGMCWNVRIAFRAAE